MNESTELNVVDLAAVSGVIATLAGWLPGIAAALSIIWLVIRIVESDTTHAVVRTLTGKEVRRWLKGEKPIQVEVQNLPLAPDPIEQKEQAHDHKENHRP